VKLYGYYRSSASYRLRIILGLKKIDWENCPVHLAKGEQLGPEFRAINPMGLVPVLDTGGSMLSQSPAIAEYLEEMYPEPSLLPASSDARAQVREMLNTIGCEIHPLQNLRVLKYLRAEYGQDDDGVAAWCRHWIAEGFAAFEKLALNRSASGQYSFADSLSLADVWLVPQVYNARRFDLDLTPYPVIVSVDAHCQALTAFANAHPDKQPDAPNS
jgi:maleylacetoacetate isomerase